MATKAEVTAKIIQTSQYHGKYVVELIESITPEDSIKQAPTVFKKGDVIRVTSLKKARPAVVIKVTEEYLVCIPLTSTESEHCMTESESRFFTRGCFANSYIIIPMDIAKENFIGIYDNPRALNNAIKELRLFIVKNI